MVILLDFRQSRQQDDVVAETLSIFHDIACLSDCGQLVSGTNSGFFWLELHVEYRTEFVISCRFVCQRSKLPRRVVLKIVLCQY